MLKVAFVIQKLADRGGGAERVLIETANEMAERGMKVEILSYENRGKEPFYQTDDRITLRNLFGPVKKDRAKKKWDRQESIRRVLPMTFPLNHLRWRLTHRGFVRALKLYIDRNKPDVLIPFLPPAITPSVIAARRTTVAVVASTHNNPTRDYDDPARWDGNPVDVRLRKKVWKDLDQILVLLPEYAEYYPTEYRHKVVVMPNPVVSLPRARLEAAVREKLIIGVGRLADVKRFDLLFEAWTHLHRSFPGWRVEIYGQGPEEKRLRGMIYSFGLEKSVYLMGATKEISDVYLRASLMCHPAKYEGFPLAVSEALAHGLPVMGFSNCSGLNSLVKDGKNGLLINASKDTVDGLTDGLRSALSAPSKLAKLGEAGPTSVGAFTPKRIYDDWQKIIERTAGRGKGSRSRFRDQWLTFQKRWMKTNAF